MKYEVMVEATVRKVFDVEAENGSVAEEKVIDMFNKAINLPPEDFSIDLVMTSTPESGVHNNN